MQAYLIDAKARAVRPIICDDFDAIRRVIGGGYVTVEAAHKWPDGSVLLIDEEGMLKPAAHFFRLAGQSDQPLAGNGVVVGRRTDEPDQHADPLLDIDELRRSVSFLSRAEADAWAEDHADKPAIALFDSRGRITSVLERWGAIFRRMPPAGR